MAFGLTDAGLQIPRLDDIKKEIEDSLRDGLGNQINLLPETVLGQIVGIEAEREALIYEAVEDVYNSAYLPTATGISLDLIGKTIGLERQLARESKITGFRLFGSAATVIPAGTVFSVEGNPLGRFETDLTVTLVAGMDEVQDIDFSTVPDSGAFKLRLYGIDTSALPFNASAAAVQAALNAIDPWGAGITVAGNFTSGFTVTFAGDAGKQQQDMLVVIDNTLLTVATPVVVTVAQTVEGVNQGTVNLTAESTGPTVAPAGTVTVIETPVSGLTAGINPVDAVVGRNRETDAAYKSRIENSRQVGGAATPEAIRARMLNIVGVTAAIVFENETEIFDSEGRPPKSYEVVVAGGDDQDIWDEIWDTKPAGIRTVGTEVGTVIDSQGVAQTVKFSRPTAVDIYVDLIITTDTDFPDDGVTLVKQAIVDRGDAFGIGKDVIVYPTLIAALDAIPGITDVVIKVGTAPAPTLDDNIPIAANEFADFDTTRVSVTEI